MGISDLHKISRIVDGRSMQRAITASVIATINKSFAAKVLRQTWPRDEGAEMVLRAAQSPTDTTHFISYDYVGAFRSLAPGSAALKLFDVSVKLDLKGVSTIKMPHVAAMPNKPIFVAEGQPTPAVQFTLAGTVLGPARKILVLSGVTRELNDATPDTASEVKRCHPLRQDPRYVAEQRKLAPWLTKEQLFARVFENPANAALAERATLRGQRRRLNSENQRAAQSFKRFG